MKINEPPTSKEPDLSIINVKLVKIWISRDRLCVDNVVRHSSAPVMKMMMAIFGYPSLLRIGRQKNPLKMEMMMRPTTKITTETTMDIIITKMEGIRAMIVGPIIVIIIAPTTVAITPTTEATTPTTEATTVTIVPITMAVRTNINNHGNDRGKIMHFIYFITKEKTSLQKSTNGRSL